MKILSVLLTEEVNKRFEIHFSQTLRQITGVCGSIVKLLLMQCKSFDLRFPFRKPIEVTLPGKMRKTENA